MKRLLVVGLALAACGSGHVAPRSAHTTFTDGGVTVVAELRASSVRVTFTPQRAGFHLYSKDLPVEGIQGLGQRTRVVVSGGAVGRGALSTTSPVKQLPYPSLHLSLPVYPDGPVTFDLPVKQVSHDPTRLVVSYAACSDSQCLPPVRDREVRL